MFRIALRYCAFLSSGSSTEGCDGRRCSFLRFSRLLLSSKTYCGSSDHSRATISSDWLKKLTTDFSPRYCRGCQLTGAPSYERTRKKGKEMGWLVSGLSAAAIMTCSRKSSISTRTGTNSLFSLLTIDGLLLMTSRVSKQPGCLDEAATTRMSRCDWRASFRVSVPHSCQLPGESAAERRRAEGDSLS